MGHFVKVETIVHSRHKKEPFTSPIWADEASSQHTSYKQYGQGWVVFADILEHTQSADAVKFQIKQDQLRFGGDQIHVYVRIVNLPDLEATLAKNILQGLTESLVVIHNHDRAVL